MKLADLKAMGGFVPSAPVEREVTWKGNTFTVHVKRLSFGQVERLFLAEPDDRSRSARFLAETICLDGGKTPLAYKDAYELEPSLATELMAAVNAVNETAQDPKN